MADVRGRGVHIGKGWPLGPWTGKVVSGWAGSRFLKIFRDQLAGVFPERACAGGGDRESG